MKPLTDAGHQIRLRIYNRADGPKLLHDAWRAGAVPDLTDLAWLLEEAWTRACLEL